jgi:Raf kinase inhibitor-like YbhB/YbcL family protein
VPTEAESLAIVMDDPDAVESAGRIWDHWVVWNVPPDDEEIPEGWDADAAGAVEGQNDFGEVGYDGPNPPDREHTYRFVVYALDTTLDRRRGAAKEEFQDAATGHVVDDDELEGTHAPSRRARRGNTVRPWSALDRRPHQADRRAVHSSRTSTTRWVSSASSNASRPAPAARSSGVSSAWRRSQTVASVPGGGQGPA